MRHRGSQKCEFESQCQLGVAFASTSNPSCHWDLLCETQGLAEMRIRIPVPTGSCFSINFKSQLPLGFALWDTGARRNANSSPNANWELLFHQLQIPVATGICFERHRGAQKCEFESQCQLGVAFPSRGSQKCGFESQCQLGVAFPSTSNPSCHWDLLCETQGLAEMRIRVPVPTGSCFCINFKSQLPLGFAL